MAHDLVIRNGTVVTPELGQIEADVAADGDVISSISQTGSLSGSTEVDASGKYVIPGAIDPHTHHGIYQGLESDAETESRSDLVGGVTTIGNYFRRAGSYEEIMGEYFDQCEPYYHDFFFSLGLLTYEHIGEIPHIVDELGITTFKWYMNYKDVAPEKFGTDCEMKDDWGDAFIQALADLEVPTTLGFHSENVEITNALGDNPYLETDLDEDQEYRGYETLVEQFPGYAEAQSMISAAALARQHDYDDNFYAVHISSGRTADELATLKDAGYRMTGETCTHYLALTTEECDERHNVNPPVRSKEDQEKLWQRVADGTISCIGTDHCCNRSEDKIGQDVPDSLPGFPSSPTMLPLILSDGVNTNRISLERAVEVTSTNTAKAFNIFPKKGTIRVGADADLVVVDLDETKTVTPELLKSGADYSPYEGRDITGWPTHTVVRGQLAYADGEIVGEKGYGSHIDRPI